MVDDGIANIVCHLEQCSPRQAVLIIAADQLTEGQRGADPPIAQDGIDVGGRREWYTELLEVGLQLASPRWYV
ncbi:hypothetical protein AWB90_01290 [Mycobacterium paraense]|uniref:Uncharacterized protein n=1 Tax=Mycobacterium paraense TaxID=767916 RepID=A0A1X2AR49_9MYCO|nr:hypothetical protein AWB90_01290 [Mycobacterium paraense]